MRAKYRAYNIRVRWPHGADTCICRSAHSPNSAETRLLSKRYDKLPEFYCKYKIALKYSPSLYGRYYLTRSLHQHTARRGRNHRMSSIQRFQVLFLILTENSFQFCGSNYLQIHGTAMGTKMAVAFANIFMARIEKQILSQSCIKPIFGKGILTKCFRYGTRV